MKWVKDVGKKLKEFASLPITDTKEIGCVIYEEAGFIRYSDVLVGNRASIDLPLEKFKNVWGGFHTHPRDSSDDFSVEDIKCFIWYGIDVTYLGWRGEVSYIKYLDLPRGSRARMGQYFSTTDSNKRRSIMRGLREDFYKYRKFI